MRKFIVSDLHGDMDIYNSIMIFLENIAVTEEVELFINGDLIDRGKYSYELLCDCIDRVNGEGLVKVNYLAGNHEFMMYKDLYYRLKRGWFPYASDWRRNGGEYVLSKLVKWEKEELFNLFNFISNLDVYHVFDEKINGKNLLLVHAKAPDVVRDLSPKLYDVSFEMEQLLWSREPNTGNKNYTCIIGHTPVYESCGFIYDEKENTFNIDGGLAAYANGNDYCDHVPLVEVKNNSLVFLVFNHSNQIIEGFEYRNNNYTGVNLDDYRKFLGDVELPQIKKKEGEVF